MIIIATEKWLIKKNDKNMRKLNKRYDTVIIDISENSTEMAKFKRVITMDGLELPDACYMKKKKKKDTAAADKRFSQFIGNKGFVEAIISIGASILKKEGKINVVIVCDKEIYDAYGVKLMKAMAKILDLTHSKNKDGEDPEILLQEDFKKYKNRATKGMAKKEYKKMEKSIKKYYKKHKGASKLTGGKSALPWNR